MNLIICSAYDSKSENYGNPVFVTATGAAVRGFIDSLSEGNMVKHRSDFVLYKIGEFNNLSGILIPCIPPVHLFNGADIPLEV